MDTTVDLDTFSSLVERPDEGARRAAEERWKQLAMPNGGLGQLQELGAWLASVQGSSPTRPLSAAKVLLFAGDHGVASLGVSALDARGGTADRVRAVLDGTAPIAVLARRYGAGVRVVDVAVDTDPAEFPEEVVRHRVRRGSGRIDVEDALTAEEAARAFHAGAAVADEEADAGTDLVVLGDLGVGATTVAAVLVGALCGTDAAAVTGRGSGIDDRVWMVKCATVRDALRRARPVSATSWACSPPPAARTSPRSPASCSRPPSASCPWCSTAWSRPPAPWSRSGSPSAPPSGGGPAPAPASPPRPRRTTGSP